MEMLSRTKTGWQISAPDMTSAIKGALYGLLYANEPDAVLNIESHAFNVVIDAKSSVYEMDVGKQLWLNRQRWSRLIKEYVPQDGLSRFIDQTGEIMRKEAREGATANLMFRDPERFEKKHRWGGCLMGAVFRGHPKKPTLTFYSRTTYIGYMGLLDAAIAHVLAYKISGGKPESINFRWCIASMQLHCFKTLPFMFSDPVLMRQLLDDVTAIKHNPDKARASMSATRYNIAKWYIKILGAWAEHGTLMLEHEKYGPFKRIKRRWMEHMGHSKKNVPPSLSVSELDFSKAI